MGIALARLSIYACQTLTEGFLASVAIGPCERAFYRLICSKTSVVTIKRRSPSTTCRFVFRELSLLLPATHNWSKLVVRNKSLICDIHIYVRACVYVCVRELREIKFLSMHFERSARFLRLKFFYGPNAIRRFSRWQVLADYVTIIESVCKAR